MRLFVLLLVSIIGLYFAITGKLVAAIQIVLS